MRPRNSSKKNRAFIEYSKEDGDEQGVAVSGKLARKMTTVVSDATINYLCVIGAIEVLPQLFQQVFIPPIVFAELGHAEATQSISVAGELASMGDDPEAGEP